MSFTKIKMIQSAVIANKSKIVLTKLYILIMMSAIVTACGGGATDVTLIDEYSGGYKIGGEYRLKQDVFLLKLTQEKRTEYVASPEGLFKNISRYYTVPNSLEKYLAGKEDTLVTGKNYQIPHQIIGYISKGSILKCETLIKADTNSWFFGKASRVRVFAKVDTGHHKGLVINLDDLSFLSSGSDVRLSSPNPDLVVLAN